VPKPKNIPNTVEISDETPARFDKFDLAILRELLTDSRRTLQEIGEAVKLSPFRHAQGGRGG
jgi:Lrp/AsnC family leucine-responsive transcriptional regulator